MIRVVLRILTLNSSAHTLFLVIERGAGAGDVTCVQEGRVLCVEDTMEVACVCAEAGVWTGLKRHYHGEALEKK